MSMKNLLYIILVLIAFASCEADKGMIKGTAVAENGDQTISSGITVKLYNSDAILKETTTTNSNGEFVFSDIKSGNYYIGATLVVGAETFDTGNRPQMVYVSDEIVKEVALTLVKRE